MAGIYLFGGFTDRDDKTGTGGPDHARINLFDDDEVRAWSGKFGVSEEQLRIAACKVGDRAADVERELRG